MNSINRSPVSAFIIFSLRHCQHLCAIQSLPVCSETKQTLFANLLKYLLKAILQTVHIACTTHPRKMSLHSSPILSLWPSSIVRSEHRDDAFAAVCSLLLTDNNSHDEKTKHNYLTCALAANSPWNFQLPTRHAGLSVHLANLPASALL